MTAMEETIDKVFRKHGLTSSVKLTEDMTPEEQEMALFESYLKEGYSEEAAAKKAKETLALFEWVFGKTNEND